MSTQTPPLADPRSGRYVRVALLCTNVEEDARTGVKTLHGLVEGLPFPNDPEYTMEVQMEAFLVIELNGDRAPFTLRSQFVGPSDKPASAWWERLFSAKDLEGLTAITFRAPVGVRASGPGRYELRVEIDRSPAAFVPFVLNAVPPETFSRGLKDLLGKPS